MHRRPGARRAVPFGPLALLVLSLIGAGCSGQTGTPPARPADAPPASAQLRTLSAEFVATHFAARPLGGVANGWHQYDGQFVVPDQAALAAEDARLKRFEAALAALPPERLSAADRHDLRLLQSAIAGERWSRDVQGSYSRNPMTYAYGLDVSVYLKRDFKPLPARIVDITTILRQAPATLDAARANLAPVLAKPFVETAIESANGTADFLEKEVAAAAASVDDPAIRADFDAAAKVAVAGFRSYAEWLTAERLPAADGSFAVGRDAYALMLAAEFIHLSPEQILEIGERALLAEQQRFDAAAAVIDPDRSPIEVFKAIQREHPTADTLLPETRKNLESLRQFVLDHHVVSVPSDVRARVEETLPPFRSTSFASMDTPGPFETKATEAYYYVTPVEPDWPAQRAEEWLSAFNFYELDVTSIHEAYPGHYVQFLALNASKAGTVAKVFGSYPFIEGWAHYCEQLMIDEGYGQPPDPATASKADLVRGAKYRLSQSADSLLRICRLCCSVKLHCQGMTVDEATRFFMDNCHYEEAPARSEAVRGTYDPGYLYYTLGKLMILKLRADWQAQEGAGYSLQRFHDELLSHGMPPLPLLREQMLRDPAAWPASL